MGSGVLHDYVLDAVGDLLAGVGALFQVGVDLLPGHDVADVQPLLDVQLAHIGDEEAVAFLLQGVDVDDVLLQLFGVAEVGELLQHLAHFLAAADHHVQHIDGVGPDGLDVVDVHPHADLLNLVGEGVDVGAQGRDVLPLDGGDEGAGQFVGHAVAALVGRVLDLVDLVHPLGHPGGVKAAEDIFQHQSGLAGKTGALDEIVKINGVLLFRHNGWLLLVLKDLHEYLGHDKADEAAPGEGEDPGQHHILDDAEIDGRQPLDGAHAHDGAGLGVGGGHRDAEQAGIQQAERAREVCAEALVALQLDHVHAHRLDDLFTADAGAQSHDHAAQKHQPDGDLHAGHRALAVGERQPQEQHADELLAVLRAVHEAHARGAGDLRQPEKAVGRPQLDVAAQDGDGLADEPAGGKA